MLDAASSGLVRALEREMSLIHSDHAVRHGTEVSSAAAFMGYLPYFPHLPMDEVLDLRRRLSEPLRSFRGALAKLSRDFEARSFDEAFEVEVQDAWRLQVAPALEEIRETLAEHGFLSEVASVALGDPRRLLAEAGGVIAAAHGDVISLAVSSRPLLLPASRWVT